MLFLIARLENRKAQVYDMPRVLKRIPGILAKERKTASAVNSRAPRPSPPQCIVDPPSLPPTSHQNPPSTPHQSVDLKREKPEESSGEEDDILDAIAEWQQN